MQLITLLAAGVIATAIVAAPLAAQSRATVDSLVSRITRTWGMTPRGGWCAEWSVVRGDSAALRADLAEISGSDRAGHIHDHDAAGEVRRPGPGGKASRGT